MISSTAAVVMHAHVVKIEHGEWQIMGFFLPQMVDLTVRIGV